MANRIIIVDEDFSEDTIRFVVRSSLPQVVDGLNPGSYYLLNTTMSEAISVTAPPGVFTRTASTGTNRSIHSGHSLVDFYVHAGDYPGFFRSTRNQYLDPDAFDNNDGLVVKSTIPGSPLHWRWNHHTDLTAGDDARGDIANFDTLVITEGGPPPRVGYAPDAEAMAGTLDYLCRFTANAILNGADSYGIRDIALWSIWPELAIFPSNPSWGGQFTYETALDEYQRSFRYMADYAGWKMRELYELPSDFRIWVFPGHLLMKRLYQDVQNGVVPGIETMTDVLPDGIHGGTFSSYAGSCLMNVCMYQQDLRTLSLTRPSGISEAQADYIWQIAWEIATSYEPVGMGGTQGAAPEFVGGVDIDPLPAWEFDDSGSEPEETAPANLVSPTIIGTPQEDETLTGTNGSWTGSPTPDVTGQWQTSADGNAPWTDIAGETGSTLTLTSAHVGLHISRLVTATNSVDTVSERSNVLGPVLEAEEEPGGERPETIFTINNNGYTGPTPAVALPVVIDEVRRFTVDDPSSQINFTPTNEIYICCAVREDLAPASHLVELFVLNSNTSNPWASPVLRFSSNGWLNPRSSLWGIGLSGDPWDITVSGGTEPTGWRIFEMHYDGEVLQVARDGGAFNSVDLTDPEYEGLQLPQNIQAIRFPATDEYSSFGYLVAAADLPDSAGRAVLRAEAQAAIDRAGS